MSGGFTGDIYTLSAVRQEYKFEMKFAHEFKETLEREAFPEHWLSAAIPYSQLKKCLKKVQRELQDLGLDPETLQSLNDPQNTTPLALKYRLNSASISSVVVPVTNKA